MFFDHPEYSISTIITSPRAASAQKALLSIIARTIESNRSQLDRLFVLYENQYRRIEPLTIRDEQGFESTLFCFVVVTPAGKKELAALLANTSAFMQLILGPRLNEAAGEDFVLGISRPDEGRLLYATGPFEAGEVLQSRSLWLFPEYAIGIRLKGQTIDELVQERFARNIGLIGVLTLMIVAGVWFIYRTVRREMELAQMKSDFVSNVSHELRTPLSLIRMFAETLQMGRIQKEKTKKEYYETIVRETERLTHLINNVLNFSRMESGKREYQFVAVDINEILRNVYAEFELPLAQEGFSFHLKSTNNLPAIRADREAITQAIVNLVDNAKKFSARQKRITLHSGLTDNRVFIEVGDQGIGIAHAHHEKIFERFFRIISDTTPVAKGSGLGLTIVRQIMDAHGGEVTVRSEPGKGSTFRLIFPPSPFHMK
jgi:two-component system phosphate regulon sensor histidine kinase PhoR